MYLDKLTHLEQRLTDAKKELKQANEKYASLFDSALKKKESDSQQSQKYLTETIDRIRQESENEKLVHY